MSASGRRLRVAVVGCGRMGAERAARAAAHGAYVRACVDVDADRARALAAKHQGAGVAADVALLPWSEIDALFVCTPPSLRKAAVDGAIAHGVAVMIEKPIGLVAAEGDALAAGVTAAGIVNAVGYMNRCRESVLAAKRFVATNGATAVVCQWASKPYAVPWWRVAAESGGPFNEQATHLVDLCRFVVGEIDAVEAIAGSAEREPDATPTRLAVALRFANGAVGTLCYTCDAPDKFIAFEVVSMAGAIRLEGWDFALSSAGADRALTNGSTDVFDLETGIFLDAVETRDQSHVPCSFSDAARTQSIVDRIRAAAAR